MDTLDFRNFDLVGENKLNDIRSAEVLIKNQLLEKLNKHLNKMVAQFDNVSLGADFSDYSISLYAVENMKMVFASDVTIYNRPKWRRANENNLEVNFGTTGSFNPENFEDCGTWRTMLAGSLVSNWAKFKPLFEEAFANYKALNKEYDRQAAKEEIAKAFPTMEIADVELRSKKPTRVEFESGAVAYVEKQEQGGWAMT